jgi:hypothetical protein
MYRWIKIFLEFICIEMTVLPVKMRGAEVSRLDCSIRGANWKKFRHITVLQLAVERVLPVLIAVPQVEQWVNIISFTNQGNQYWKLL